MSIFSDPENHAITVPNTVPGMATLVTGKSFQACLKVFGNPPGAEDFGGGVWVVDYSNDGSTYVAIPGVTIVEPTVVTLPLPAAFCRLRCVVAPSPIAKTPLAVLCLR